MKKTLSIKNFYLFVFGLCIVSLVSAVYIEHILEHPPCKLCLYQRIPYIISIFICFIGFNYNKNFFWLYLLILTFTFSIALSGYHVGIENNIFKEFSGCTNNNLNITNKLELLNSLNKTLPNCKNVNFRLLGLSLATINLIISLFIVVLSILFIKHEKNK
tara:strand:- start:193 stop:672 length:480 start_codon:yes stop_codon:yes gene_type:complete